MFNKNFWIGIAIGLFCVSLIGVDIFKRINTPVPITPNPSLQSPVPNIDLSSSEPVATLFPNPSSKTVSSVKTTPKPSTKTILVATPTPTPKLLRDFYVQSHSQLLLPEQTSTSEYVETQTVSRQRLEVDFAANNVSVGDTVMFRLYEDGNVRKEEEHTITGTTNFHFADVYYPTLTSLGTHTVRFVYNENRGIPESDYGNNEYTFTYKIIQESTPPTFTIDGPYLVNGQTCMRWINLTDNKSVYTDVWAKWKIDDGSWSNQTSENPYGCISGTPGSSHTYYVHAEDFRGNVREDSRVFTILNP